jgi:hypothetical protein
LNSSRIGEKVELKNFKTFVWKGLERAKKNKNEYKSSLGGHRQKPIDALNSPRIGEKVELKIFQNLCLEKSGKVWKELKKL